MGKKLIISLIAVQALCAAGFIAIIRLIFTSMSYNNIVIDVIGYELINVNNNLKIFTRHKTEKSLEKCFFLELRKSIDVVDEKNTYRKSDI